MSPGWANRVYPRCQARRQGQTDVMTRDAEQVAGTRGFLPAVEGMRACAAIGVVITHVAFETGHSFANPNVARDAAGRVHQAPDAVERDQSGRVAAGDSLQAIFQQSHPFAGGTLTECGLDPAGRRHRERQISALIR